jgi:hypothetical protein
MGRPSLRWFENIEKDLRENEFKRWRQKAVDRFVWESIVRETKALR